MTPYYIPCVNSRCTNPVTTLGDLCDKCKAEEAKYEQDHYDHEKERRQAEYEHKKGKKK